MSERKRKRGRPRTVPVISYGAEMRMRNNIPRNIKKPKYLLDAEEESIQSRGSSPCRNVDERGSLIKNSRGYNPDFDDRNSEFHYGSDFEEVGSENETVDSDTPSLSDLGLLSDDEGVLSDDYSRQHDGQGTPRDVMSPTPGRAVTPDAVWLQDRNIPKLSLPPSANDLLIPTCYFMPALGIYEVLRHFRTLVRLSPFRFEEFCGALLNPQQTVLLAEMHIALLRALIREDESQSTHFGPMDHKDSINIMLYLVDPLTWPQVLNNYLQSDLKSYHSIVKMMETCSYPYTSLQNRLQVLRALTDEVLCVSGVREELISEGKLRYDDHCRACHKTGDLLCCDSCTAVFHLDCLEEGPPPLPLDDWTCSICRKHQLWKVKGEEYRAVCGDGWRWWARHRRPRAVPASSVGLRAGPDKMMVGVHMTGGLRGLPVAPDVFTRLAAKTPGLLPSLYSPNQRRKMGMDGSQDDAEEGASDRNEIIISNAGTDGLTQKVEVMVTPLEQFFEDGLVNVSRSLVGRTRLVYPKVPAPSQLLDGLLARRVVMPTVGSKGGEESADMDVDGETSVGEEGNGGTGAGEASAADATIQEIPDSQRSATHRLRPAGNLLKEIRQHKLRYEALDESVFHYRCYSPSCTGGTSTCYSPLCRAKTKTREKLLNAVKNYTIVTSKPSPYPEIGVNDVIKVSEMDFSEDRKKGSSGDGRPSTPTGVVLSRSGSVPSTPSCGVMQQHSAGHIIGSSVELPRTASGEETEGVDKTGQISVRLDQDLDEKSQSSDALEHKFALKAEKVAAATTSCSGKVFLKKRQMVKPKKTVLRLPQISRCRVGRDRYSLLVLPQHELRTAARRSWRHTVSGYHHLSKSNASVWPYPCPRPLFRLTWLYRTAALISLSGAALQLRLLWSCLRWDDMHEKGPSDGKRHITTNAEIIQTEILKRKYSGRFSEKTEYLRRKVTIPFEVPKPIREFTPSQRSGLRKRRRAQSPEDKRPESVEEWIPEEQLLLWEIRLFGERLERAANQPKKDALSASSSPALKITLSGNNARSTELKQRLEERLKQQRTAFLQQQREGGRTLLKIASLPSGISKPVTSLVTPIKAQALSAVNSPTKKLMRTKDGRLISVQTLGSIQPASLVGNSTIFPMAGSLPKVQIASQPGNKVIRLQTVPANPRMILPRAPRPVLQQAPPALPTIRLPDQNIQILRMPDGHV